MFSETTGVLVGISGLSTTNYGRVRFHKQRWFVEEKHNGAKPTNINAVVTHSRSFRCNIHRCVGTDTVSQCVVSLPRTLHFLRHK